MNYAALRDIWTMFQHEHSCSVDRMLCNPKLRAEFVSNVQEAVGSGDEETILWNTVSLRKTKKLPSVPK